CLRRTLQPIAKPCSGSHRVERNRASKPASRATCPITCISPQEKPRAYASEALTLLFVYKDATYLAKKSGSQRMAPGFHADSCSTTAQTSVGSSDCAAAARRASRISCEGTAIPSMRNAALSFRRQFVQAFRVATTQISESTLYRIRV